MQRDATGFLFAIGTLILLAVGLVLISKLRDRYVRRGGQEDEKTVRRQREAETKRLIDAGTHVLFNGHLSLKCKHCERAATHRALKWVRDDGVTDLVRRAFGAPARVRVGEESFGDKVYCESHAALAFEEYRIELGKYETERAGQERDWEVRRARFQHKGVDDRLAEHIQKHEREIGGRRRRSEVPAKVVPFVSSSRTGTDPK